MMRSAEKDYATYMSQRLLFLGIGSSRRLVEGLKTSILGAALQVSSLKSYLLHQKPSQTMGDKDDWQGLKS